MIRLAGSVVFFAVFEAGRDFVFGGEDWLDADFQRPVDGEFGIIPQQSPFGMGIVRRGDLVMEIRGVAHHQEAMGTTGWDIEAFMRIRRQHVSIPHPIGRRALTQIDDYVVYGAGSYPNQFSLGGIADLVVEPAKHMF